MESGCELGARTYHDCTTNTHWLSVATDVDCAERQLHEVAIETLARIQETDPCHKSVSTLVGEMEMLVAVEHAWSGAAGHPAILKVIAKYARQLCPRCRPKDVIQVGRCAALALYCDARYADAVVVLDATEAATHASALLDDLRSCVSHMQRRSASTSTRKQ
jgi:hypothetical protein